MALKHGRDRLNRWLYMMLPYEIAYAPISNLIILYMLDLGGTVVDASYAIAFSNLLAIAASVFWGQIIEYYNKRKIFIVISIIGLSASLVGLSLIKSIFWIIVVYGAMTFLVIANTTPFNMLVMETNPKDRWAYGFSRLQMLSSIGVVFSYVITALVSGLLPINYVILMLLPFSIVALTFTRYIQEPSVVFPRLSLFSNIHAFRSRLLLNPLVFLIRTRTLVKRHLGKRPLKVVPLPDGRGYMKMLFSATLVFYIGSTVFNTAYPAGLKSSGFSDFEVLFVILVGNIVQAVTFYRSGVLAARRIKSRLATSSLIVRGSGYMVIGITFVALSNLALLGVNIVLYSLVAGVAYALFYTSFNTMVFEAIGTERRGSKLGFYSSFVGLGSLIGAPIAGYASYYIGYWFSFALSGVLIVATSLIIIMGEHSAPIG